MHGSDPNASGLAAAAILSDLVEVVTEAATRIHVEHRRDAARWTITASLLAVAGIPVIARRQRMPAAALAAGLIGSLAAAGRHRRLAELARPE